MSHIILKDIDYDKIDIRENYSKHSKYNIVYRYIPFYIIGIPIHCKGNIINNNNDLKFYPDSKTYEILYNIQNTLKSKISSYKSFINSDERGNYLYFHNNIHIRNLNEDIKELYLNIKCINKNNYNTVIHII